MVLGFQSHRLGLGCSKQYGLGLNSMNAFWFTSVIRIGLQVLQSQQWCDSGCQAKRRAEYDSVLLLTHCQRGLYSLLPSNIYPRHADVYVGRRGWDFRVSLFVCPQHNSKINDPELSKLCVGNNLWLP